MKFNKTYLLVLSLCFGGLAMAQQNPNNTFYRYNMNLINPAYAGVDGTDIGLSIRNQWVNIDGAPESRTLFFGHNFGKNVGLGVSVINDKTFIETQTSIALDFSYKLNLSESMKLFLGLKGAINSYDANLDGLRTLNSATDPSLSNIDGGFNPNFGLGALLRGANYFISFSIPKILASDRLEDTDGTIGLGADRIHWYFAGGYDFPIGKSLIFKPSTLIRYVNAAPLSIDFTAAFEISRRVELGMAYRIDEGISGLFIFKADHWLNIGYAYESAFEGPVKDLGNGTHEIFLKIRL